MEIQFGGFLRAQRNAKCSSNHFSLQLHKILCMVILSSTRGRTVMERDVDVRCIKLTDDASKEIRMTQQKLRHQMINICPYVPKMLWMGRRCRVEWMRHEIQKSSHHHQFFLRRKFYTGKVKCEIHPGDFVFYIYTHRSLHVPLYIPYK